MFGHTKKALLLWYGKEDFVRGFFEEFLFLTTFGIGVGLFFIGFKPVFKLFTTILPGTGLQEAVAA